MSREDVAGAVYLAAQLPLSTTAVLDKNCIDWHSSMNPAALAGVISAGVMSGYPDLTFKPKQLVTRGEAAKILSRVHITVSSNGNANKVQTSLKLNDSDVYGIFHLSDHFNESKEGRYQIKFPKEFRVKAGSAGGSDFILEAFSPDFQVTIDSVGNVHNEGTSITISAWPYGTSKETIAKFIKTYGPSALDGKSIIKTVSSKYQIGYLHDFEESQGYHTLNYVLLDSRAYRQIIIDASVCNEDYMNNLDVIIQSLQSAELVDLDSDRSIDDINNESNEAPF